MSLTLHLSPDLEQRLREEAEQQGLTLEELLAQDLEARWGSAEQREQVFGNWRVCSRVTPLDVQRASDLVVPLLIRFG